jgi:hypothetical protein
MNEDFNRRLRSPFSHRDGIPLRALAFLRID